MIRQHTYRKCDPCKMEGHCPICDGGLLYCVVCKCAEAEMGSYCPGPADPPVGDGMKYEPLSNEELDQEPWRLSRNQLREQAKRANALAKAVDQLRRNGDLDQEYGPDINVLRALAAYLGE